MKNPHVHHLTFEWTGHRASLRNFRASWKYFFFTVTQVYSQFQNINIINKYNFFRIQKKIKIVGVVYKACNVVLSVYCDELLHAFYKLRI